MLQGILQGLLKYPLCRQAQRLWQSFRHVNRLEIDLPSDSLPERVAIGPDSSFKSNLVQHGRVKAARQLLEVLRDISEALRYSLHDQPKIRRRIGALSSDGQLKKQACHSLSIVIMQFARDPLPFVLLQSHQAAGQSLEFGGSLHRGLVLC